MSPYYYIVDIAIVIILVFFAWRGAKKGLVLTVIGLITLVVAFFGARFLSNVAYKPVANIVEPVVYQQLTHSQDETVPDASDDPALIPSLESLIEGIKSNKMLGGISDLLTQSGKGDQISTENASSPAKALSHYLAELLAKLILFVVGFILLLLILFLVGRLLNLVTKLPGLHALNTIGGLLLGLVKAVAVVVVLVWACRLFGWLPQQPTTPILSLFTRDTLNELLNKLVV